MAACSKCRQPYQLAIIGRTVVWLAVEPWASRLCSACKIEAR